MFDIENLEEKFHAVVASESWADLQRKFNKCNDIYVLGHGGNLAIADHTAVDITRLSSGQKNAICPGSAIVATSFINDSSFDQWMVNWLSCRTANRTKEQMKKSLVYGISSSGNSTDVIKALQWANDHGMQTSMISGQSIDVQLPGTSVVTLNTEYYHNCEVLTLLLQYQLTHGSGRKCPPIGKNRPENIEKLSWKGSKNRKHSFPDETVNIGIDFDGVIHKNSKGFHDGTIYDDPIEGSYSALEELSKKYNVIVFTCKAKPDRGLINGKTGTALVWEWLKKYDMDKFVTKVTSEKPRAVAYIDDKGIAFKNDWKQILEKIRVDNHE
tara:strand:- start:3321 stop:4301 length:981 start_codon:yes stop_codon:yes gene_type:complete